MFNLKNFVFFVWIYFLEFIKGNPLVNKKGSDLLKKSFTLRRGDQLIIDTKKHINYFSSSINFSSNNWKIDLPGIRDDLNNNTYLEDFDLNAIKIIHHQIYMIILHKNKKKISFYMRE